MIETLLFRRKQRAPKELNCLPIIDFLKKLYIPQKKHEYFDKQQEDCNDIDSYIIIMKFSVS